MNAHHDTFTLRRLSLVGGIAAALLLPSLSSCPGSGVGAAAPPPEPAPRRIEVTGTARLDIPPDRIDLTLALEQKRPSPRFAVAELLRKRDGLVAGLRRSGVRQEAIVLSQVGLSPSYSHSYGRTPTLDGYLASVSLVATLRDSAQIGALMEVAARLGVTRISSSSRTSKGPEMKKRVREMALRAAREKAEQIARGLGLKLGAVQTVRESQHESWMGNGYGVANNDNRIASAAPSGDPTAQAVAPDAIRMHLGLTVAFAIR